MAAPKLKAVDKTKILQMLAERHSYAQIAAEVGCSPDNITHYATTYKAEIGTRREAYDATVIDRGLRSSDFRIVQLAELAQRIKADIDDDLYYIEFKVSSKGDVVEQPTFKSVQIAQYRAILDDIAKELGQRKQMTETEVQINLDISGARDRLTRKLADRSERRRIEGNTQQPE